MTEGDRSLVRVSVGGLVRDHRENPVVLLKGTDTDEVLPIWIGQAEALAIDLQLRGETFERPLTHDLLKTAVESLGAKVVRVAVTDLKDNTFFAKIYIQRGNEIFAIDARPSDSIALAIRTHAPIFVARSVFESHKHALDTRDASPGDADDTLRKYLRDLDPGEF
jgi:bifunctional DNase/RNase